MSFEEELIHEHTVGDLETKAFFHLDFLSGYLADQYAGRRDRIPIIVCVFYTWTNAF